MWGLTSQFFMMMGGGNNVILFVLSGLVMWLILWKSQYEISINLLDELWNRNLINLFVSPLTFTEWLFSVLILGIIKVVLSFSFAVSLAFLLYKVKIFEYGFQLLPFMLILLLSGWAVGIFVTGLIFRYGTKIQAFCWTMVWIFGPFSAIYYPVSILPQWAQEVSKFIPMSYAFEGMRTVLATGNIDLQKFIYGLCLVSVYLILGLIFLFRSFKKVMDKGLLKVD
jgi:ABC-2 type transport system permease protein